MTKEQYSKLPPDQMFEAAQELLKNRRVVRVYHQDISEAGFKGPCSYLRSVGINCYRHEHSVFGGCSFIEVDNLPDVLPKGVEVVQYDFEDKRLIFEPTNPGK